MDQDAIIQYIADTFPGVEILQPTDGPGAGDTFFYDAAQRNVDPARRLPFATIVTKDYGDFDNASQLDRPGVFRLNIGVSRDTFRTLFGHPPKGDDSSSPDVDFAALDRLMPHPVYAAKSWVCVLNPSATTFEAVKPLLADAHAVVANRHARGPAKPD
jgi:hypothetical protein